MQERGLDFWNEDEWKEITRGWPPAVYRGFASRLRIVQLGGFPQSRDKPLKGFDISLREMWHRDGQRVVYTVEYANLTDCVFILDAFEKDSREGREMRKADKERIKSRVKVYQRQIAQLRGKPH